MNEFSMIQLNNKLFRQLIRRDLIDQKSVHFFKIVLGNFGYKYLIVHSYNALFIQNVSIYFF